MKKLIYIICLQLCIINFLSAQCTDPDASIWKDTWTSCDKIPNPIVEYGNSHWIQYNFGSVRNLSKTWVWNTNDPNRLNQGFNLVKIDYSEDGQNWTTLGEMNFPKAKGEAVYGGFAGPDLSNLKAQYVLLTALSNHGDGNCAGLAEIKFNLLPEAGQTIPTNTEEDEEETDEENPADICSAIEEVNLTEYVEIETGPTEAFLFFEIDEAITELPLVFEYRSANGQWIMVEMEEGEVLIEGLTSGATYDYRISLTCEEAINSTPISTFQTTACTSIDAITIEEVTETELFLIWPAIEEIEEYFIAFNQVGDTEIWDFEVLEAEVYLDELTPNTAYKIRIGILCGEDIIWSETIEATTLAENDFSTAVNTRTTLSAKQVHLFPNPTSGQLTVRIKAPKKDVLNYSISNMQGRILFRNTTKLFSGSNDLSLNLSMLTDGTYWINGVTINQRARVSEQIIKISR